MRWFPAAWPRSPRRCRARARSRPARGSVGESRGHLAPVSRVAKNGGGGPDGGRTRPSRHACRTAAASEVMAAWNWVERMQRHTFHLATGSGLDPFSETSALWILCRQQPEVSMPRSSAIWRGWSWSRRAHMSGLESHTGKAKPCMKVEACHSNASEASSQWYALYLRGPTLLF